MPRIHPTQCRNGRWYPLAGRRMKIAEYVAAFLFINHYK